MECEAEDAVVLHSNGVQNSAEHKTSCVRFNILPPPGMQKSELQNFLNYTTNAGGMQSKFYWNSCNNIQNSSRGMWIMCTMKKISYDFAVTSCNFLHFVV